MEQLGLGPALLGGDLFRSPPEPIEFQRKSPGMVRCRLRPAHWGPRVKRRNLRGRSPPGRLEKRASATWVGGVVPRAT